MVPEVTQPVGVQNEHDNVAVISSPGMGRCLRALQDFQPKEVVLEEIPLVSAPSGQTDLNTETDKPYLICIGCYLSLKDNNDEAFNCENCGWPFCSELCHSQDITHKTMECDIFKRKNIHQCTESIRSVYFIRCICISKLEDTARWEKILNLTSTYQGGKNKEPDDKDLLVHNYLTNVCGLEISQELLANLNGFRTVNAFQINYCEQELKRFYGMALYDVGSMASHACNPNSRWRTIKPDEKLGFPIRIQANDLIRKGALVTIAYRNKCLTTGTLRRREELFLGHGFLCQCDRCGDATEFNTYFSAQHCTHCAVGYLLPKTPSEPKSDWICKTCGESEGVSFIREIIDRITQQIRRAKEGKCKANETCCKLDIIIKKYTERILHPNHYLIIWAEFLWLQFLEYNLFLLKTTSLKYEIFALMTTRAKHCSDIYTKFFSQQSRFYGYFEKISGLAYYLYYLSPSIWNDMSDKQRLRIMRTTLAHFESSLIYDGWDSDELRFIETKLRHIKTIVPEGTIWSTSNKCGERLVIIYNISELCPSPQRKKLFNSSASFKRDIHLDYAVHTKIYGQWDFLELM
ncbi:unnamed protein product [Allacma fusca]|uniref:SET domain-containing protein n=1 Tax=Allacma fusca TaxID=39272 RepID=A0A8J2K617_9HEXA|nr:unnamed protein product [Allacma fusca]